MTPDLDHLIWVATETGMQMRMQMMRRLASAAPDSARTGESPWEAGTWCWALSGSRVEECASSGKEDVDHLYCDADLMT